MLLPAQVYYDNKDINCMFLTLSIFKIYVNIQYDKYICDCPLLYLVIHFQNSLSFIGCTSPRGKYIVVRRIVNVD